MSALIVPYNRSFTKRFFPKPGGFSLFRWRVAQLFYETVPRSHAKVVRIERMVQPVSWQKVDISSNQTRWKGWMPGVMTYCSPVSLAICWG